MFCYTFKKEQFMLWEKQVAALDDDLGFKNNVKESTAHSKCLFWIKLNISLLSECFDWKPFFSVANLVYNLCPFYYK